MDEATAASEAGLFLHSALVRVFAGVKERTHFWSLAHAGNECLADEVFVVTVLISVITERRKLVITAEADAPDCAISFL